MTLCILGSVLAETSPELWTHWFAGVEIAKKEAGWYKIYVYTYITGQIMDLVLKGKKNTVTFSS